MNRSRAITWMLCLVTAVLALGLRAGVAVFSGYDLFSITVAVAIPVGAIGLALLATSGFWAGMTAFQLKSRPQDFAFLLLICVGLGIMVYAGDYIWFAIATKQPSLGLAEFRHFVAQSVMKSIVVTQGPIHAPPTPAGEFGWLIFLARAGALAAVAKIVHSQFAESEYGR